MESGREMDREGEEGELESSFDRALVGERT